MDISQAAHLRFLGGPKYPGEQAGRSSSNACDKISKSSWDLHLPYLPNVSIPVNRFGSKWNRQSLHTWLLMVNAMMPGHQGEDDASKMHCCFAEVVAWWNQLGWPQTCTIKHRSIFEFFGCFWSLRKDTSHKMGRHTFSCFKSPISVVLFFWGTYMGCFPRIGWVSRWGLLQCECQSHRPPELGAGHGFRCEDAKKTSNLWKKRSVGSAFFMYDCMTS